MKEEDLEQRLLRLERLIIDIKNANHRLENMLWWVLMMVLLTMATAVLMG